MASPKQEQEICITCGLCCDGTLFKRAILKAGEKGNLPKKMETAYEKKGDEEFFHLPCSYFEGKCSIYDQKKAHICSAFRCNLLKEFAQNKVSKSEALSIVDNAMQLRQEIRVLAQQVFNAKAIIPFQQILEQIGEAVENKNSATSCHPAFEMLKIKVIILEALLIRHFKSKKDFTKMIEQSK